MAHLKDRIEQFKEFVNEYEIRTEERSNTFGWSDETIQSEREMLEFYEQILETVSKFKASELFAIDIVLKHTK